MSYIETTYAILETFLFLQSAECFEVPLLGADECEPYSWLDVNAAVFGWGMDDWLEHTLPGITD